MLHITVLPHYVRELAGAVMEDEVRRFLLRYASCPDNFQPHTRQMLFNLAHSFEWAESELDL